MRNNHILVGLSLFAYVFAQTDTYAEIAIFKPVMPTYNAKEYVESKHKVIAIGTTTINHKFPVPIYGFEAPHPLEDGMYSDLFQWGFIQLSRN